MLLLRVFYLCVVSGEVSEEESALSDSEDVKSSSDSDSDETTEASSETDSDEHKVCRFLYPCVVKNIAVRGRWFPKFCATQAFWAA